MPEANAHSPGAHAPAVDWLLDRVERLCAVDTTTGSEDRGLPVLRALLAELDARVELFEIAPGRHNVLATWSERPRLLLSTHLDAVPPYLPPRRDGDVLWGRGTCDAKGQAVAQLAAIAALLEHGRRDLAWLGVVGEETDSIGATRAAATLAPRLRDCLAVIDGEPTGNRLATGQRGSLQVRLACEGVACHSGMPQLGRSAIWPLLDWLQRLRAAAVPEHPELGPQIWNLGLIDGGTAPNVVPPHAEALLFVRSLPGTTFVADAEALAPEHGRVEVVKHTPPDLFPAVDGFARAAVPFGSDAPHLRALVPSRTVALVGPGRIEVAHTVDEHIDGHELRAGVELLLRLCQVLAPPEARA